MNKDKNLNTCHCEGAAHTNKLSKIDHNFPCHCESAAHTNNKPCHPELVSGSKKKMLKQVQHDMEYTLGMTCNGKHQKSAFTFAELMISLVIIAVITALLYPTISEVSPNNNKQLFRSAYKTVEMVVSDIMASNETISAENANDARANLCTAFKNRLNAVGIKIGNNNFQGCEAGSDYTMQTSNGMRWWFANYDTANRHHTVFVDVNASNNNTPSQGLSNGANEEAGIPNPCFANQGWNGAAAAGAAGLGTTGCFRLNNSVARDTFRIQIRDNGQISVDEIAAGHLRDTGE